MSSHDYHLEVSVPMDSVTGEPERMPDGTICSIHAPYESAFLQLDNETVWDNDGEAWVEPDDDVSARADTYLIDVLAFPARVINIFREWTGPNGWDINIMSDIAALMVRFQWVPESDPIINGYVEPVECDGGCDVRREGHDADCPLSLGYNPEVSDD